MVINQNQVIDFNSYTDVQLLKTRLDVRK